MITTPPARLPSIGRLALLAVAWGLDVVIAASGEPAPSAQRVGLIALTQVPLVVVLVRRRRDGVGLALALLYGLSWSLVLPDYQPFLIVLIAAYGLFRHAPTRRARAALALVGGLFLWYSLQADKDRVQVFLVHLVVLSIPWVVAVQARRTEALQQAKQQAQQATYRAETALALQEDRLRLARELHDTVSHAVTAMLWQAAGARVSIASRSTAEVGEFLTRIETSGQEAMTELHQLLGVLHSGLEAGALEAAAGLARLPDLIRTVQDCGVPVDLSESGPVGVLGARIDHVAYRVVQEALTNVMKHGGEGARAEVGLTWDPDALQVRIASSIGAAGSDRPVGGGFGLAGLTERVQAVGGRLTAGRMSAERYEVSAWLPVG